MAVASKILVVDDSRHVRDFFAESVLRPAGYNVLLANDGVTGLRLAREARPDLIIADLQMPGMTGLELKRALSAAGDTTPLILVTAEGSESIASQATLAGVVGYLPKPVDVDVMLAVIEQALTVERLRRERREALRALEKRVHQLETLQGIGRALTTASLEIDQVLVYVLEAAVRLTGADSGRLALLEERGAQLAMRAVRGPDDASARAVNEPCRDNLPVQVVSSNRPVRWPMNPEDAHRPGGPGRPLLYVPLRLRDQPLGVLGVESQRRQRYFAETDVGPLLTLADYAAIAISNARQYNELQIESNTDSLTGLSNRRHFYALADSEFQRALRFRRPLSVIMLDIDRFKLVNDTHGHAAGDQVLAEVARRLRRGIRTIDVLGRYGGEEFVLCLPETAGEGAAQLAERLRQRIEAAPVDTLAGALPVTISLGVVALSPQWPDLTALIQAADGALYAAKEAGRNQVKVAE